MRSFHHYAYPDIGNSAVRGDPTVASHAIAYSAHSAAHNNPSPLATSPMADYSHYVAYTALS